jgi:hypothetical protein
MPWVGALEEGLPPPWIDTEPPPLFDDPPEDGAGVDGAGLDAAGGV